MAPGERVDRIISEALSNVDTGRVDQSESSISLGSKFSSTKSHTPSPRDFEDPSVADLVQRPYGAFDRARDMLTLHFAAPSRSKRLIIAWTHRTRLSTR